MLVWPLILTGALVGILVGLTSLGGGSVLTPALVLLLGIPPSLAVGSDVLIASVMKLVGGGVYAARRAVHWPTVLRLSSGSVPGALLGIALLNRLPKGALDLFIGRSLGVVLVLAGTATLLRLLRRPSVSEAASKPPSSPWTVLLGFVTGLLVGVTSIGSGSLLLCVLAWAWPLRSQTLVGTDLVHAFLLSSAATVGHLLSGRVDFALAGAVLAGAVPGVLIGARLTFAIPERALRTALATLLVGVGTYLSVFRLPEARAADEVSGRHGGASAPHSTPPALHSAPPAPHPGGTEPEAVPSFKESPE
ncbi:MAG: sulfite exporter TauE/SafE family protein [Planctomycetes bacterium]|nr:sulfite exporter TauE/SafE family protein [Planctomycetota bacterium]